MADVRGFMDYARLDFDDAGAQRCFDAAVAFARAAGIPPVLGNSLYDLFVYAVALHFSENRGFSPGISVNAYAQDSWVTSQITALKLMLEYGTGKLAGGESSGGA